MYYIEPLTFEIFAFSNINIYCWNFVLSTVKIIQIFQACQSGGQVS